MVAPLHIGDNPLKLVTPLNHIATIVGVAKINSFAAAAVEDRLGVFFL